MTMSDVRFRIVETGAAFGLAVFVAYIVGDLIPGGDPTVVAGALAIGTARLFGLMSIFPLFTENDVTGLIGLVIALTLSWPMVAVGIETLAGEPLGVLLLFGLATKELLLGFLLGVLFGAPFWGLQAAAHLVDFTRDAAMPNTANPITAEESTPLGPVYTRCALALFVAGGGLTDLLDTLYASYAPLPLFGLEAVAIEGIYGYAITVVDRMWVVGLVYCAPICILIATVELTVAFMNRSFQKAQLYDNIGYLKNLLTLFGMLLFAAFYDGWTVDAWQSLAGSASQALQLPP